MKSVYLGRRLLLRQIIFKMMEDCLLFLIVIFQVLLLFFLYQDPVRKEIVLYLLPKHFRYCLPQTDCFVVSKLLSVTISVRLQAEIETRVTLRQLNMLTSTHRHEGIFTYTFIHIRNPLPGELSYWEEL